MANMSALQEAEKRYIWPPCTALSQCEHNKPLEILSAAGAYITTSQGMIIDAISSWWSKSLGHGQVDVRNAIQEQMNRFEHVMPADTTHQLRAELGALLARHFGLKKAFFACDGSSAVEIAIKLAFHVQEIRGQSHRGIALSLANSYHGETLACLAVSDCEAYQTPKRRFGLDCRFIAPPYTQDISSPLNEEAFLRIIAPFESIASECALLIVEPLVQGAGGMRLYSVDFLKHLYAWAKRHHIIIIADEIMTGVGRTGSWLASDYTGIKPDLICLSKGLTGGFVPMSVTLVSEALCESVKEAELQQTRPFLHSHTHSANALAISAAHATLSYIEQHALIPHSLSLQPKLQVAMQYVADASGLLENVRGVGALIAADFKNEIIIKPESFKRQALASGIMLRPIDNTLYWCPPLNSDDTLITGLAERTLASLTPGL